MIKKVEEGLGDLAHAAERDHEVQMARAELYKIAKYAIKLHELLKGVSEAEGLEGWVQSKITKSAEMIGSVYHHLDYQEAEQGMPGIAKTESKKFDPLKHVKNPTAGEKKAAKDVKRGSYADRAAMLKSAEKDGRLKERAQLYKESLRTRLTAKLKG